MERCRRESTEPHIRRRTTTPITRGDARTRLDGHPNAERVPHHGALPERVHLALPAHVQTAWPPTLYVGKWAHTRGVNERQVVQDWGQSQIVGGGPIEVYDVKDVVEVVRRVAAHKTYINDPVIVAIKVLTEAGALN